MKKDKSDIVILFTGLLFVVTMTTVGQKESMMFGFSLMQMAALIMAGKTKKNANIHPVVPELFAMTGVLFLTFGLLYAVNTIATTETLKVTLAIIAIITLIRPYFGVKFTMKRGRR